MAVTKGFDFSNPDSIKNAENNEEATEHFYRYVKAGETISVGLLQPSEYAQVEVYDVYPITQTVGIPQEDLFKKAKEEMFRLADIAKMNALGVDTVKEATEMYNKMSPKEKESFKEDEGSEWYKLIKESYRLDKQVRFLFGFYDFNTGSPFVIQTTKKQAEGIYKKIAGAWTPNTAGIKQAEAFGFTISKGTGGFSLDVDTNIMIAMMSPEEQEKHRELRAQEITEEQFSTAHYVLSVDAQKDAIKEFASHHPDFDLEKVIGGVSEKTGTKEESPQDDQFSNVGQPLDISDDDLPF